MNVAQSCLTICDPMDYTVLKWIAVPFSRGSSQPRDQTAVSCTAGRVPGDSGGKESAAILETQVQSLGGEDPLEKELATHCSILGLPLWLSW